LKTIIKYANDFFKKLGDDHISEYSASSAYYTFLSFIPFIILLLSLIKYINVDKDTLAQVFEAILPSIMKNSVLDIIQEMYSKSIEAISISAIFLLWSASKSFFALNKGLYSVYNKKDENYIFLLIKGVVGAILALLLVIAILVLILFGNSIETAIRENFGKLNGILDVLLAGKSVFLITIMFFIFLFVYKFSANKENRSFKKCMFGAGFTAISWYLISFFFSIYVNIFTNFSIIYGSLATIIIILMWLYSIIYAIFLGAEINIFFIQIKNNKEK
jgi:membrane protein